MKKLLAFVICISVLASLMIPVNADTDKCDCGFSPVVYVAALGSATIYKDPGTDSEQTIFRPETESTVKLVFSLIIPIIKLAVTKDYDVFADSLIDSFDGFLGALAMDENGDSRADVSAPVSLPTDPTHGIEHSYYFGYDFRIDPLETAERLNAYIEEVKRITKHDKVNLKASSMGGVMALTYFRLYGTESVDSCILQCSPIQGTAVAGEIMTRRLVLDTDSVVRYASQALPELENDFLETVLSVLIKAVDKIGLLDAVCGFGNKLIEKIGDTIYDDFLIPVLGRMPGLWSFVPDEYYEDAKEMMLGESPSEKLISRLDFYHYEVQCKASQLLNDAHDAGVRMMIVCGSNMQRTPLVSAYMNDSDATVDTKYASVGAVTAPLLGDLGDGYVQQKHTDKDYLSPDNRIDASTCALPDYTWFIDGMLHSTTHDGHDAFYDKFFLGEDDFTVFSDPDYPQFLVCDVENQLLLPMN